MSLSRHSALLEAYVAPEKAYELARAINEDMAAIGFEIQESTYNPRGFWREYGIVPQAEYQLPCNQFDINSPVGSEALEGSFLTCGNLLRLGQCAILGRQYIPQLWPSAFAHRLRGRDHLDALNEVWWLKFWRGIEKVAPEPKVSANDPDFDWRLDMRDGLAVCTINLEVKRRTSNINQFFKHRKPKASVSKIGKKFRTSEEGSANVAAITLYRNVSQDVDRYLREWLDTQDHLHGLLIWTEGNHGGMPLKKFFKESHRWAEFLVNEPDPEDLKVAGCSSGTLCEAQDMPAFLEDVARRYGSPLIKRL
jgi:hypothetical protein